MFSVAQRDLLHALKRFRRMAKQDLLASTHTSDPGFWFQQAEARRAQYDELMQSVRTDGVEAAYRRSVHEYTHLPLSHDGPADPQITGKEKAYEMFFLALGIGPKEQIRLKNARRRVRSLSRRRSDHARK